jgi:hypothetical protein
VSVVAVRWYCNSALRITFINTRGQFASQLLYRENENNLNSEHRIAVGFAFIAVPTCFFTRSDIPIT